MANKEKRSERPRPFFVNIIERCFFIDPEGVVIKTIALQEIGTPSVRPGRIVFQGTNAVWLNVAFYESP